MLETKHITKKFINKVAVDDISFTLEAGKIYALLGPNGSGKTTWMKMVATLTKPTEGEILYKGEPVGRESRKEIAYMSTEPYFYSWMKISDVGEYYQDFFEDFSMPAFREFLDKMGLAENLKVKSLSSGMMAKLKIAATMARKAKLYLLDEPLNGIDLIARDQIMETIITSLEDDVTLVVSSHLVEELEQFVNAAVFIKDGKVVDIVDVEDMREEQQETLAGRYRSIMQ